LPPVKILVDKNKDENSKGSLPPKGNQ